MSECGANTRNFFVALQPDSWPSEEFLALLLRLLLLLIKQGNDSEVRHILHLKNHQTQTCHMKLMLWSKTNTILGDLVSSL